MTRIRKPAIAMAILTAMAVAVMLVLPMTTRASGETAGSFTISATNGGSLTSDDYSYEGKVLTIKSKTPMTISGTSTTDRIVVADGVNANITLYNVNIDVSASYDAAFKIADNSIGNVTITLARNSLNTLISGEGYAGLEKNGNGSEVGTLTINGEGCLTATGGAGAAGIGGGSDCYTSNIVIDGGSIKATGGEETTFYLSGAAIGSGVIYGNGEGVEGSKELTPKNSKGEDVYLFTTSTSSAVTKVVIDGTYYSNSHGSEYKIYIYLTVGPHDFSITDYRNETYSSRFAYNSKTSQFENIGDKLDITATDSAETLVYGKDYTYPSSDGVLTIMSDKAVTISNTDPATATSDSIIVDSSVKNANITLAGVNINAYNAAFDVNDRDNNRTVTITIADDTTNTLTSTGYAGLLKYETSDKLIIQGGEKGTGKLVATGAITCAGIGSNGEQSTSNITIKGGTIIAYGGVGAPGIGGGSKEYNPYGGNANNITIEGGIVTAIGGQGVVNGIGGGQGGSASAIVISGGSVNATIGITPTNSDKEAVYLITIENENNEAITIDGKDYPSKHDTESKIYAYLTDDIHTIKVGSKTTKYAYYNGQFEEVGTELEIEATSPNKTLVYGTDYTYTNGVLTILSNEDMTISNADPSVATTDTIVAVADVNMNITLDNVNIDVSGTENACAFKVEDNSTSSVIITLADGSLNTLISGKNCAGVQSNNLANNLCFNGNGSLEAKGGEFGAGIGGGKEANSGYIRIYESVVITACGGEYAPGIGGGGSDNSTPSICKGMVIKNTPSVKAVGNKAVDIGGGSMVSGSSYTCGLACQPGDGEIGFVYLLVIDNENGDDITINNISYPKQHGSENKLYAYLSTDPTVKVGEKTTNYILVQEESRFYISVDIPDNDETYYSYNGKEQTYVLPASDAYEISGNKQTNAGSYTVIVSLTDKDNTIWSDRTKTDQNYSFNIYQASQNITLNVNPTSAIAGTIVTATAAAVNPDNPALTDVPAVKLTYKIGDGSEIEFKDSFKIPDDTASNTVITVYATVAGSVNYTDVQKSATVVVTDCTHPNIPTEWTSDGASHWQICPDCNAKVNKEACSGGTATCTKKAVCDICSNEYGTIDSDNHANKESKWSYDETNHWHKCPDCQEELDKAAHISSGAATSTTAEVCTECGYVLAPATGDSGNDGNTGDDNNNGGNTGDDNNNGGNTGDDNNNGGNTGDDNNNGGNGNTGSTGGHYSGGSSNSGSGSQSTKPSINGSSKSWSDISSEIQTSANGSNATINLNGNYNIPADVIKAIADKGAKVTFVVDSWRSWTIDGSEIDNPEAVNLTVIQIASLDCSSLRGTVGTKLRIEGANKAAKLTVTFKKDYAGKFANIYRKDGDKLVFVDTVKVDANGNAVLTNVSESGDYAVMLSDYSDRPGDMDNDGKLTAMDASGVLKYVLGISDSGNLEAADIDGDGKITALDASLILKRVIGLA